MWFKNIQLFRLMEDMATTAEELEALLAEKACKPCAKTSPFSYGWVSPFGPDHDVLVHSCNNCLLLAAGRQERVLPAAVINDSLRERIKLIEQRDQRKVYSSEKKRLKDEILFDLLPKAFIRQKTTYAYLDLTAKLLLVDSASHSQAEELTKLLRDSLGRLHILPPITNNKPAVILTDWLQRGHCQADFDLADSCQLLEPRTGKGIIKCEKQDLGANAILSHLKAGKQANKLGLVWQQKLSFVLNDDLSLSRIRPLDIIAERDEADLSPEQILDNDFAIMSAEFRDLLPKLFTAFGGLED